MKSTNTKSDIHSGNGWWNRPTRSRWRLTLSLPFFLLESVKSLVIAGLALLHYEEVDTLHPIVDQYLCYLLEVRSFGEIDA